MIEICLNESVDTPYIETMEGGVIRLFMKPSTPIADALKNCEEQIASDLMQMFTSLFSERGFSREFETHQNFVVIRPRID
jgi:hypothetical protein